MATNDPDHIPRVTPTEAYHRGPSVGVLDEREPDEHTAGHRPGARHVPPVSLHPEPARPVGTVLCLCRSGRPTATVALGIDARRVTGDRLAWAADQLPIERSDGPTRDRLVTTRGYTLTMVAASCPDAARGTRTQRGG